MNCLSDLNIIRTESLNIQISTIHQQKDKQHYCIIVFFSHATFLQTKINNMDNFEVYRSLGCGGEAAAPVSPLDYFFNGFITCVADELAEIKAKRKLNGRGPWSGGLGVVAVKYRLEKHRKFRSQPLY